MTSQYRLVSVWRQTTKSHETYKALIALQKGSVTQTEETDEPLQATETKRERNNRRHDVSLRHILATHLPDT